MGQKKNWTASPNELKEFQGKVYTHTGRNFKRKIDAKRYSEELRGEGLKARVSKNPKIEGFHGGKYAVYSRETYRSMNVDQSNTVERYLIKKKPRKKGDFKGIDIWFTKHFNRQLAIRDDWIFNVKSSKMAERVKDDLEWNLRKKGKWYENIERDGLPSYYCVLNKLQVYCAVKDKGKLIVTTTFPYSKTFLTKTKSLPKILFEDI